MVLFPQNVKKIKGTVHKNGDGNGKNDLLLHGIFTLTKNEIETDTKTDSCSNITMNVNGMGPTSVIDTDHIFHRNLCNCSCPLEPSQPSLFALCQSKYTVMVEQIWGKRQAKETFAHTTTGSDFFRRMLAPFLCSFYFLRLNVSVDVLIVCLNVRLRQSLKNFIQTSTTIYKLILIIVTEHSH